MAWRPAHARPAEARPSRRDGRRAARRGGGRRSARPDRRRRRRSRRGRPGARSAHALASVDLVEIDPELARLAESNAARNGLQARARVLRLDALNSTERREAGLVESASCVVTNPPFFDAETVRASPDEGKARAHVLAGAEAGASLADWIQASLAILAPGGRFVMIHRPDALARSSRRSESRLGAVAVLPFIRRKARAHIVCLSLA